MPTSPRRRRAPSLPPDELVLAAVERAQRHYVRPGDAVPLSTVSEHLALPWHAGTARRLRPVLDRLIGTGELESVRRHDSSLWELTALGRRHVAKLHREERLDELPESPQHREWRAARASARRRLDGFRRDVTRLVARADQLLAADPQPHSDAWLLLGDDLQRACQRVGTATHCLREWPEPGDSERDTDTCQERGDRRLSRTRRARLRVLRFGRRSARWDA